MNEELHSRVAAFFSSIGAAGFAAVINFADKDTCVVFVNNFPAELASDLIASAGAQIREARGPITLN